MNHRFVLTGGPGAGKTTLLNALGERGYPFVPESARRIIKERLAAGLSPRPGPVAFAQQILSADIDKYRDANACDVMFFDRGVLDALYMLEAENALTHSETAEYVQAFPYNDVVFLLPPWEAIYGKDSERDQTFDEAIEVFKGMKSWYQQWGYETLEVPHGSAEERVAFMLRMVEKAVANR
ncbi:MAG: AAA family ATPase [Halomonas sp.]|nr:AAA family ATPase [Halomonas sp.]MBP5980289.1 AAA family ATPase [Halomonas sp.]